MTTTSGSGGGGEPLKDIGKRLRARMADLRTGETQVAVVVAGLAKVWDIKYKKESGDMELGPWLLQNVDPTVRLFRYMELAAAHYRCPSLSNRVESRAFRWMHRQIPDVVSFNEAMKKIGAEFRTKTQGSHPLTMVQVKRICASYVTAPNAGISMVRALQERIVRLETQIRGLGAEPVE
jgi:hypothetical protein